MVRGEQERKGKLYILSITVVIVGVAVSSVAGDNGRETQESCVLLCAFWHENFLLRDSKSTSSYYRHEIGGQTNSNIEKHRIPVFLCV